MNTNCYTFEGVSYGHPDKLSDIIADSIVDEYLNQDKDSRCGIEVMVKDNYVVLGGEVKSNANVDCETIVRNIFDEIKYPLNHQLQPQDIHITNLIGKQSIEISKGVDKEDKEIGSGDQGCVFGYADNTTIEYMPFGNQFARDLWKEIIKIEGLGPDIKTQVNVSDELELKEVVVSTMHQIELEQVQDIISQLIDNLIISKYKEHINDKFTKIINLNGEWKIGGPVSDCGITGRKLAVDFYGSSCQVGGGNLSGKDLSKVDRSGAYFARYLAKNIVAAKLADSCIVHLGYIISNPNPCNIDIKLTNGKVSVSSLISWLRENVDMTVKSYIERFNNMPLKNTSKYGHFGINDYPWEKLDLIEQLSNLI